MPKKRPVLFYKKLGTLPLSAIQKQNAVIERKKRREILARTKQGRRDISRRAAGADMTDVADLPVITGLAPPRETKPTRPKVAAPLGNSAVADPAFLERMRQKPTYPAKKNRKPRPAAATPRDQPLEYSREQALPAAP